MRKTLLLAALCLTSIAAQKAQAQDKRVTIHRTQADIVTILNDIEKQTDYMFVYGQDANVKIKRSMQVDNVSVKTVLTTLFAGLPISYELKNKHIVLMKKSAKTNKQSSPKQKYSGTVTDEQGEPLVGVTIKVKGSQAGTITDIDGNYTIEAVPSSFLEISYIGFESRIVSFKDGTYKNIVMKEDAAALEEVVVVGYGALKKKDLTGAINHIEADKFQNERPQNVQDLLRSASPGLNISASNDAKGDASISIRGQRSLSGGNTPLIVLNGMIFQGDMSEINPTDIESIDILKDASSAAIYGAKSANGVVIITTKKGTGAQPTINFDGSVGFVTMGVNRHVYDPQSYLQFRSDYAASQYGWEHAGYYAQPTEENLSKYNLTEEQWKNYDAIGQASTNLEDTWLRRINLGDVERENYFAGKTFDWYDNSFQTGLQQDYNVSVSGATPKINYYWSVGYQDSKGLVVGNRFKNYRSNLRLDGHITDFMDAGIALNLQQRCEGYPTINWVEEIQNSPYSNPYNEDGTLNPYPMGSGNPQPGKNGRYSLSMQDLDASTETVTANTYLKIKLPYSISYQISFAPRYSWNHGYFWSNSKNVFDTSNGSASRSNARSIDWTFDNMIKWSQQFADKHQFDITMLHSAEKYTIWQDNMSGTQFTPSDILKWHNMAIAGETVISSTDTKSTGESWMGRLFYSFDNRYMLTASMRRDGYSAFGKSHPWATFSALALAWNFTHENFFKWNAMSQGKLRLSWGTNGNRDIGIYQAMSELIPAGKISFANSAGNAYDVTFLQVSRMANYDLKWESTSAWNIGIDYGFLNNRIFGSIEYYYMPTTNLLMSRSLPAFTGYSSFISNLGKVVNSGFEFSLTSINIDKKDFKWSTTFNLSYNKNRIKHLYYQYEDIVDENGKVVGSKEVDDVNRNWFVGHDISTIWNVKFDGIWQEEEAEEAAKYGQRPGDARAEDVNGDYVIDQKDRQFLGQSTPKYNFSLRNDFTFWKDLSVSFNFYGKAGHKRAQTEYLNYFTSYDDYVNQYERNYWTPENRSNSFARLKSTLANGVSPLKVVNGGFIRMNNISVAYNLPGLWVHQIKAKAVKVNFTIRNVAVFKFNRENVGWDPETGSLIPRTYTFGANITF